MEKSTLIKKINRANDLNDQIKSLESEFKKLKTEIIDYLKENNIKELTTGNCTVNVQSKTTTIIDVNKLFDLININDFKRVSNPSVTITRKILSEENFKKCTTENINEFSCLRFKHTA